MPLIETIDIVIDYVYGENSVCQPPFQAKIFRKLLLMCSQSYFMFDDVLYQQINGVSMGGPLAPSMANAFLAHLENTVLRRKLDACIALTNIEPSLMLQYVDDVFCLFNNESDADTFLTVLNNLHPCITFTLEKGSRSMPFLDVNVSINSSSFSTTVYRKETHTGVFLNFHAVAPTIWKRGDLLGPPPI